MQSRVRFGPRVGQWIAVPVTLLALLVAPSAPASATSGKYPSAADTAKELGAVCQRLRDGDNPYYGRGGVEPLRRLVRQSSVTPEIAASRRARLAYELMRLGELAEAVDLLEQALTVLDDPAADRAEELRSPVLKLLGLAHLQIGETAHCLERRTATSCIVPLAPEAIHVDPRPSRRAAELFQSVAEREPDDLEARWLLNVARMLSGDFPAGVPEPLRVSPALAPSPRSSAAWPNVAPALGLDATDLSGGALMEDFDGDGLLDLITSTSDPCDTLKAYRNAGDGSFREVTESWGLHGQLGGLNLVHADYDNDGAVDILVLRGGWWGSDGRIRNSLLRNDLRGGSGLFLDVTVAAGLAYPAYPTQTAAWADYDGDGDLDLYVGNESTGREIPTSADFLQRLGSVLPSQLFRNNGDGTFTDVGDRAGVTNLRYAKGVAWGDYDNDGDPDLYVSNIGPNRLYRNDGEGRFEDVAESLAVTEPRERSFPVWFFDYDNDGWLDLLVTDYGSEVATVFGSYMGQDTAAGQPLLYRNLGGRFEEVSRAVSLSRPILPMGTNYGDLDNDGFLDLFFGTGVPDYQSLMPNVVYRNAGGLRFEEVTFELGLGHLQKGHGVAFGDIDNDGDQDVFQQLGGAYPYDRFPNALYLNPGNDNAWVVLRLIGKRSNRYGIGARIEVRVDDEGGSRSVHVVAGSGGSFGGSSLQQEIGLGVAETIAELTIRWPGSGTRQVFRNVAPRRVYQVIEGQPELREIETKRIDLEPAAGEGRTVAGPPPR